MFFTRLVEVSPCASLSRDDKEEGEGVGMTKGGDPSATLGMTRGGVEMTRRREKGSG